MIFFIVFEGALLNTLKKFRPDENARRKHFFSLKKVSIFGNNFFWYNEKCIFHGCVIKIINHFAKKSFGFFNMAHLNTVKKFWQIFFSFNIQKKMHFLWVQDFYYKNALMLSRKDL